MKERITVRRCDDGLERCEWLQCVVEQEEIAKGGYHDEVFVTRALQSRLSWLVYLLFLGFFVPREADQHRTPFIIEQLGLTVVVTKASEKLPDPEPLLLLRRPLLLPRLPLPDGRSSLLRQPSVEESLVAAEVVQR
jgi:hypothetical protein